MYYGRTNSTVGGGSTPQMQTQAKEVKATSFPTQVIPDEGYYLTSVKVNAPDNLAAGNIKKDVTIAGVTGTYEGTPSTFGTANIKPTAFPTVKNASDDGVDGYTTVTVEAPDNLVAENIKQGVNIAGVVGTMSAGGASEGTEFWMRMLQNNGIRKDSDGNYAVNNMLKEYWPSKILIGNEQTLALSSYILADKQLVNVELPESATDERISIPSYCFQGSGGKISSQPYMTVTGSPNHTYYISASAFRESKLEAIPNIRYADNTILDYTFYGVEFKTSCIVPEGVTTLQSSSFSGISAPNNTIVLPTTLTTVNGVYCIEGSYAKHLNIKILATTPPTLSSSSSIGNYVDSITVPQGTLEAYQTATNWTKFADKMTEESA